MEVICSVCGKVFKTFPSRINRVKNPTCSKHCNGILRGRDWATYGYLGPLAVSEEGKKNKSQKMKGDKNPSWKGGITFRHRKGNYVNVKYVQCPVEYLSMARKDGYIMEHRLIMAQWIGRPLLRVEVVHHKDHNPLNNKLDNLELYPTNKDHKLAEAGHFNIGVYNLRSLYEN